MTHKDNIEVACHSADLLDHTGTNEVVAENNCGCGVSCTKQCGSGCTTKKYKINGCITVNESVEHHLKSGEKTCKDGRSYRCCDCMQNCGATDPRQTLDGDVFLVGNEAGATVEANGSVAEATAAEQDD